VWPYLARKELRKGLSVTLHNIGSLFVKVMTAYVKADFNENSLKFLRKLERKIRLKLMYHEQLLSVTKTEPRLKGPFQYTHYRDIIGVCAHYLAFLL
jgi:hypothetical protein